VVWTSVLSPEPPANDVVTGPCFLDIHDPAVPWTGTALDVPFLPQKQRERARTGVNGPPCEGHEIPAQKTIREQT